MTLKRPKRRSTPLQWLLALGCREAAGRGERCVSDPDLGEFARTESSGVIISRERVLIPISVHMVFQSRTRKPARAARRFSTPSRHRAKLTMHNGPGNCAWCAGFLRGTQKLAANLGQGSP
jgi:hypothetical protein